MKNITIKNLEYGQYSFFFFIAVSYLLLPQAFLGNRGFSFLGTQLITIVPSSIGFILTSYFMYKASKSLDITSKDIKQYPKLLKIFSFLLIGMVFTPYSVNNVFNNIHFSIGTLLYLIQIYLIIWLIRKTAINFKNIILISLQILGTILLLLDKTHVFQIMLTGQLLSQISFAFILINSSKLLLNKQ